MPRSERLTTNLTTARTNLLQSSLTPRSVNS